MPPEEPMQTPETEPSLINQETPKPSESTKPETTLINEKPPLGAPEKYADWKLPDGYELDKGVVEEASPLFKKLGLTQDQSQELVDFYTKHAIASSNESMNLWKETRESWMNEVKADPEIGGKLDQVRTSVGKMLDQNLDTKTAAAFREAMDYTGAGNNPAFIKALYTLSQKLGEGAHVSGNGPVEVRSRGAIGRPSAAQAIYGPTGPASGRIGPNDR